MDEQIFLPDEHEARPVLIPPEDTNILTTKHSEKQKCNYCPDIYFASEMTSFRKGNGIYYKCSPCNCVRKRTSDVLSNYGPDAKSNFKSQANTYIFIYTTPPPMSALQHQIFLAWFFWVYLYMINVDETTYAIYGSCLHCLHCTKSYVTSSPPFTAARRARARSTTLGEPLPAGSRYNRPAHNQEMWMGAQQPHGVDAPRRRLRLRPALSPPPPASPRSLRPAWRASACTARPRGAAPPLSSS